MEQGTAFEDELAALAAALRMLRIERGNRSYRDLATRADRSGTGIRLPVATQSDAFRGKRLLGLDTLMGLVRILHSYDEYGREIPTPAHNSPVLEPWRTRWRTLAAFRPAARDGTAPRTRAPLPVRDPVPAAGPPPVHLGAPPRDTAAPAAPVPAPRQGRPAGPGPLARPASGSAPYRLLSQHSAEAGPVVDLAFSPEGDILAGAVARGGTALWPMSPGSAFRGEPGLSAPLAFGREGLLLAAKEPGSRYLVQVSSRTGARPLPTLHGHCAPLLVLACSPDGMTAAGLDQDRTVHVWDRRTGRRTHAVPASDAAAVRVLAFDTSGRLLAADSAGRLWEPLAEGPPTARPPGGGVPGEPTALSPDGSLLACIRAHEAELWDTTARRRRARLTGHGGPVTAVAFSPDGTLLATGSADRTARIWQTATGVPLGPPLDGHPAAIGALAFSPDAALLALACGDAPVRVYGRAAPPPSLAARALAEARYAGGVQLPPVAAGAPLFRVAFSPDGARLAAAGGAERAYVWDAVTGRDVAHPAAAPWALAFSPDGATLATAGAGRSVTLWNLPGGGARATLTGHRGPVKRAVFAPDGRLLATGGADTTVRLWDPAAGTSVGSPMTGHSNEVVALAFSPDGTLLASGGADHVLWLWNVPRLRNAPGRLLRPASGTVWSAAFSPDGRMLVTAGADGTVRRWNPLDGEPLGDPIRAHRGAVYEAAFAPDGSLLATGGADGAVRLWDPGTGEERGELLGDEPGEAVHGVAFCADGTVLASCGTAGSVRRWILGPL